MMTPIDKQEQSTNHRNPSHKPVSKKVWRRILCIMSAVVFFPLLCLIAILSNTSGQHYILQTLDNMTDSLSIGRIEGGLQEGLQLSNVHIQSQGVETAIEKISLQWDFSCLWRAEICLSHLNIQAPNIRIDTEKLPPSPPNTQRGNLKPIWLPISFMLKNVHLGQLSLAIDQNHVNLAQFQTALSLNNTQGLTLEPTLIEGLKVEIQSSHSTNQRHDLSPSESTPIDWAGLEKRLAQPSLAQFNEIPLPFELHLQDIQGKNWQYLQMNGKDKWRIDLPHWQLQGEGTGNSLQLKTFKLTSSVADIQGQGRLQLNGEFPIDLQVQTHIKEFRPNNTLILPKTAIFLNVSGALKQQTMLSLQSEGGVKAQLNATTQLNQPYIPLQIKLNGQGLQYPFDNNAKDPLKISTLKVDVTGNVAAYQAKIQTNLQGFAIPKSEITLDLTGGLGQANIDKLVLNSLKGQAVVTGNLHWEKALKWQSAVNIDNFHIGLYLKEFPAVLSGQSIIQGEVNSQQWQIHIPDLSLKGTVSQRPLTLKSQLSTQSTQPLDIQDFTLTYGENTVKAQGKLSEQSDLKLDIHAPNLQGFWENLSGSLIGQAKVSGNLRSPNLVLNIAGSQLQWHNGHLTKANLKGDITATPIVKGDIQLDLSGFNYQNINLSNAKLIASGDENKHQLQLQSQGEPLAVTLNLNGQVDRTLQKWKGELSQINIHTPIGAVKNNQNIVLNYDHQGSLTTIYPHCWNNVDVDLCFPQAFKVGKSGDIPFEIKGLNLDLVNKLIKQNWLQGQLKSKGQVAWSVESPLQASMQVEGKQLMLSPQFNGRTLTLDLSKFNLNADLQNNNLVVKSDIQLQDQGKLTTEIKMQDLTNTRTLGGSLNLQQINLHILNPLLSKGGNIQGLLMANLNFAGNLAAPLLNGTVQLKHARTQMKVIPMDLTDGELTLHFQGSRSTLKGFLQTQEGLLHLQGEASWKGLENWQTRLQAQGEQFKVSIPSMAKLKINPNVVLNATPKYLELSGLIDIPWARIAIGDLPASAVAVSQDEVILDSKTPKKKQLMEREFAAKTKSGMEIRSDLKINVGDDVKLEAYGLNTKLNGVLSIKQDKGKLGLYGQINLKDGRYSSFGQDLLIRKGIISFSGMPSQPMLNIEAIRNPTAMENTNITAGVKVVGIADSPEVTVFSQPSTSKDEALSYLLTGRSLEYSGQAGSGGSIGAALLGMGLSKSGKVVGGIGQAFGIQDLNLGTQGVGDSSKVVVSGNITPRLQLKYGVGLFDGLAEFTVRYKLLPQLYLQSVSGVNQAVDLLYQFEF